MKRFYALITLVMIAIGSPVFAQTNILDFMANPNVPKKATAPVNTVTSASQTVTYTNNPAAGNTLVLSAPNNRTETYIFFSDTFTTSTEPGVYQYGIKIATAVDDTYTTLATMMTNHSEIVRPTLNTGTNVLTLKAAHPFYGVTGNSISIVESLANAVTASNAVKLVGGISVSRGKAGALWLEGDTKLWVKTSDSTIVSGVWKYLALQ
jgi:hypothetical protein